VRRIYFDKILVSDGEIPEKSLAELEDGLSALKFNEGKISNCQFPDETSYQFTRSDTPTQDMLLALLVEKNIIPSGTASHFQARFHRMKMGGRMYWHQDTDYTYSISVYLNDVKGGRLEVALQDIEDEVISVPPKRGRVVLLESGIPHRVTEVESGVRDSIQVFVRYEENIHN
jgi:hypothetical protein